MAAAPPRPRLAFGLVPLAICILGALEGRSAGSDADGASAPDRAQLAVAAFDAGRLDEVRRLGGQPDVDPWLLADELQALGRTDIARVVAEGVRPAADRAALERELRDGGGVRVPAEVRAAVRAAENSDEPQVQVWDALASAVAKEHRNAAILTVRVLFGAASAAETLPGDAEATAALARWDACTVAARRIGWTRSELTASVRAALRAEDLQAVRQGIERLEAVAPLGTERLGWTIVGEMFDALGRLYVADGQPALARTAFYDAASAHHAAEAAEREALALANVAAQEEERGRLVEALTLYRRARATREGAPDSAVSLEIEQRMASLLADTGSLTQARALFEGILARLRALPTESRDSAVEASVLGNLSRVLFLQHAETEAHARLEEAEALYRSAGYAPGVRLCTVHRAWYEAQGSQRTSTAERLASMLDAPPEGMDLEEQLKGRVALGRWQVRAQQFDAALRTFHWARREVARAPATSALRALVPGGQARALALAGRMAEVLEPLEVFLTEWGTRVDGIEAGSSRTLTGLECTEILSAGVRACVAAHETSMLWRTLETNRGLKLLAALGGRSALGEALLPAPAREGLAKARSAELKARRALVVARSAGPAAEGGAAAQITALEQALEAAEAAKREAGRKADEARRIVDAPDLGGASGVAELAALRLRAGEVVVSLSLLPEDDTLLAFVVSAKGARSSSLTGRAELVERVRRLRQELSLGGSRSLEIEPPVTSPRVAGHALLEEVRTMLVERLGLEEDVTTVFVIPDGELAYVPYPALFPGCDVCLLPSGTLLPKRLRSQARRAGITPLALGDVRVDGPVLMGDVDAAGELVGGDAAVAAAQPRTALRLRPLPATRAEAVAVAGTEALLGERATGIELLKVLAAHPERRWSTIHFACHGVINPDFPTLSGLALSDGLLTAHEIFALRLNTDLVVLSACDTATDAYVMGEGISGLVRAFLYAGAPRVLASLWKVPDEPTAALMTKFYELLRADPQGSVAKALREAQAHVSTVDGGKWAAPENWAAWTLWGVP